MYNLTFTNEDSTYQLTVSVVYQDNQYLYSGSLDNPYTTSYIEVEGTFNTDRELSPLEILDKIILMIKWESE